MKPKERVRTALEHEEPDRVPIQASFTPEIQSLLEKELRCEGRIEVQTRLGNDMLIAVHGVEDSFYASEEDEYQDEWGITWTKTEHAYGHYTEIKESPLSKKENFKTFRIPDPTEEQRYEEIKRLVRDYGDEYWIVGSVACTIFEVSWYLRGLENLMKDMVKDKEFVHELMDKVMEFPKTVGERLTELGVDMIRLGDDVGKQNGMLISPQHWREFLKPRMSELIGYFKDLDSDVKIAYHSDGDITPIIDELIEIELDVLNPIQPKSMDPAKLKRDYGDRLSFWGTLDIQETLPNGTPEDVGEEVKERIETVGKNGGLILGPTHNIQPDTPLENVLAFYEAAKEFGQYK